jgi:hypothetical protein
LELVPVSLLTRRKIQTEEMIVLDESPRQSIPVPDPLKSDRVTTLYAAGDRNGVAVGYLRFDSPLLLGQCKKVVGSKRMPFIMLDDYFVCLLMILFHDHIVMEICFISCGYLFWFL